MDWDDEPTDDDAMLFFFIAGSANEKALKEAEVLSLHLPLEAETAVDDLSSMSISIDELLMFLSLLPLVSAAAPLPDTSGGFASDTPNISSPSISMLRSSAFGGAVCMAENAWLPLADALGMRSWNFSK